MGGGPRGSVAIREILVNFINKSLFYMRVKFRGDCSL